jgi:quercetin dioxygenase-like cupin family protein
MNQGHVQSGEVINLELLKGNMDVDASYAIIKTEDMEVIRMALPEGKEINQHSVEGEMEVQCLTGHIQFNVEDTLKDLTPDDWMFIERNKPFSYMVKENTILLVTILFNDEPGKAL